MIDRERQDTIEALRNMIGNVGIATVIRELGLILERYEADNVPEALASSMGDSLVSLADRLDYRE